MLFSLVVLLVAAVPVGLICVVIFIESHGGNPIFTQVRVGKGGKPITIYKIRTMVKDSNDVEKYFTTAQLEEWKREQKVDGDPRITRTGNFLRVTSLDELPQFVNVLKGELSVVGPRPITEGELGNYGNDVDEFLSVLPGITGWWQATERNEATYLNGRRQELELYYVRNRSLRLDAEIILRTVAAVAGRTGR